MPSPSQIFAMEQEELAAHTELVELMETLEERTHGTTASLRNFERCFARLEVEAEIEFGEVRLGWQTHPQRLYVCDGSLLRRYVPPYLGDEVSDERSYMSPNQAAFACDHLTDLMRALAEAARSELSRIRPNPSSDEDEGA